MGLQIAGAARSSSEGHAAARSCLSCRRDPPARGGVNAITIARMTRKARSRGSFLQQHSLSLIVGAIVAPYLNADPYGERLRNSLNRSLGRDVDLGLLERGLGAASRGATLVEGLLAERGRDRDR